MRFLMLLTLLLASTEVFSQDQNSIQDLLRRIEDLERQHEEIILRSEGSSNPVNSFLNNNLTLGGFFDSGITAIEGPDTDLQVMNHTNLLGLNIAADFSPRLHFVSQFLTGLNYPLLNPHNNPDASPGERKYSSFIFGAVLTQAYLEYTYSNHLKIQGGIGYVPFGQALQQRELVLFARRGGPQLLRIPRLISSLWNGIQILGEYSRHDGGEWGYNVYTTNPIDPEKSQMLGLGGRLWANSSEERVVGGLSAQIGKYESDTDRIVGSDLRIKFNSFSLMTEYIRHITDGRDPWSAYIEPGFYFDEENWLLYAFGDYAESPLSTIGSGANKIQDAFNKWEYGVGVNWLPTAYTRIRLTYTLHDYVREGAEINSQNRDYQSLEVSAGIAF